MTTTDYFRAFLLGIDIFAVLYLLFMLVSFTALAFRANKWEMGTIGFVTMGVVAVSTAAFWLLGR